MIGIFIALLLGYWIGKNEKKKQIDSQYVGLIKYNGVDYGSTREGESVEDLA